MADTRSDTRQPYRAEWHENVATVVHVTDGGSWVCQMFPGVTPSCFARAENIAELLNRQALGPLASPAPSPEYDEGLLRLVMDLWHVLSTGVDTHPGEPAWQPPDDRLWGMTASLYKRHFDLLARRVDAALRSPGPRTEEATDG